MWEAQVLPHFSLRRPSLPTKLLLPSSVPTDMCHRLTNVCPSTVSAPLCLSVTPSVCKPWHRSVWGGGEGEEGSQCLLSPSHVTDGRAEAQGGWRGGGVGGPHDAPRSGAALGGRSQTGGLKLGLRFDLRWGSGFRKAPRAAVTGRFQASKRGILGTQLCVICACPDWSSGVSLAAECPEWGEREANLHKGLLGSCTGSAGSPRRGPGPQRPMVV